MVSIDASRLQVITPYTGHRKKQNLASTTYSLDDINLVKEETLVRYSKENKKMEYLINEYVTGKRNRNTVKASYILRDTAKVMGAKGIPPTTFAIFVEKHSTNF